MQRPNDHESAFLSKNLLNLTEKITSVHGLERASGGAEEVSTTRRDPRFSDFRPTSDAYSHSRNKHLLHRKPFDFRSLWVTQHYLTRVRPHEPTSAQALELRPHSDRDNAVCS